MKKLVLSLFSAGLVSIPAGAAAIQTDATYVANIVNGRFDIPVGKVSFDLDADIPGVACRYIMGWSNDSDFFLTAAGFVFESKTHGASSCLLNATRSFTTVVSSDPAADHFGFDRFRQFRRVRVTLGEDGPNNALLGLIQFLGGGPPSAMVNALSLTIAS